MQDNNNFDPLEDLIKRHSVAIGDDKDDSNNNKSTDEFLNEVVTTTSDESAESTIEIDYGDNDIEAEIAKEEAEKELIKQKKIEELNALKQEEPKKIVVPNEFDESYNIEAIGFQAEKLSIVTTMFNKVIAKYHITSGEIPESVIYDNTTPVTLPKRAVMGELIQIYHEDGVISKRFEDMILNNWIMPDGSSAKAYIENGSKETPNETNESTTEAVKPETKTTPTININVEKNTPVTVNVDESIVANMDSAHEVNIIVKEISNDELKASSVIENSDEEGIIHPYDQEFNDVPITLPMSGYRCVMRPINWMDFLRLSTPSSNNSSDNEMKSWSVIYDHIKNVSIGDFASFEMFLKNTKYNDRELLMWALLVATSDEEEEVGFTCDNDLCKHHTNIKYHPREIIHFEKEDIPDYYDAVHKAAVGKEARALWESIGSKYKRYKLPHTGIIVDIEQPSAWTFITDKLPIMEELQDRYKSVNDIEDEQVRRAALAEFEYLTGHAMIISAMTVVGEDGKEYRYTSWDKIEEIICKSLDSYDSSVLLQIIKQARSIQSPASFYFSDFVCPKCGKKIPKITISNIGKTLLFQVSRRLNSIEINLIEMD